MGSVYKTSFATLKCMMGGAYLNYFHLKLSYYISLNDVIAKLGLTSENYVIFKLRTIFIRY